MDYTGKKYLDSKLSIAAMHKLYVLKCKGDNIPKSDIVKKAIIEKCLSQNLILVLNKWSLKWTFDYQILLTTKLELE